jgi:peroxiredoxin
VFEEVRRDHDLKFPLIQDPDERIAAIFGVQHWPTTIFINREGVIDRVQFGLSQEQREEVAGARS